MQKKLREFSRLKTKRVSFSLILESKILKHLFLEFFKQILLNKNINLFF